MAADADALARIEPWPTRPSRVAMTEFILIQLDNADFLVESLRDDESSVRQSIRDPNFGWSRKSVYRRVARMAMPH
jgi:hypothetical protein